MKKRFGGFFRTYGYLSCAFFIPCALMFLIYAAMEVWPFGENSVLVLDLNGQYVYYFDALREIITEGGSLLYSWSRALGGELMGLFAYYLSSPFSLIVALFPRDMITEALLLIILLKVGLSGLSFGIYLHKSRPSKRISIVIFSTLYALTSYSVVQSMNIMWMDAVIILPLVLLGIERLIDRRGFMTYTLCLAYAFITNFYIGYMVGIFSAVYAVYYYFTAQNRGGLKKLYSAVWRFALFSVIAIMISMVIILPAYYSLTFGKTEFQDTSYAVKQQFDFFDLFVKMLPSAYDTVRPEGLPIVYCGLLSLIMLPLYFLSDDIPRRKKIGALCVLALLVLSFNTSTIDIFWHGMSRPNWLNYRYSFIFCAMVLIFAYDAFVHLKGAAYKRTATVCTLLALLVMLVQKMGYEYITDFATIWLSVILCAVYAVALLCQHTDSLGANGRAIIAIIVCFELFLSGLYNLEQLDRDVVFSDRSTYRDFIARFEETVDEIQSKDDGLYRMEKTVHRKVNDPMALGFAGLSNSTSTLNASVIDLLCDLGYASRSHWSKYLGGTPVSDSLLGVKYIIAESKKEVSRLYNSTEYTTEDLFVAQNPYAQQILFAASERMLDVDFDAYETPMERLNALCGAMLGLDEPIALFVPVTVEDTNYENCAITYAENHLCIKNAEAAKTAKIVYKLYIENSNEVFLYFPTSYYRECKLWKNGASIGTYFGNESRRVVSLGNNQADQYLYVTMQLGDDKQAYYKMDCTYFWSLDEELFREVMTRIGENPVSITEHSDTYIAGSFTKTDGKNTIFTSIPYDEGWIVEIDGERVDIVRNLGALIAIDTSSLDAGEHEITLRYMPSCVIIGASVTFIGSLALFAIVLISARRQRRAARAAGIAAAFPSIDLDDDADIPALQNGVQDQTPQEENK